MSPLDKLILKNLSYTEPHMGASKASDHGADAPQKPYESNVVLPTPTVTLSNHHIKEPQCKPTPKALRMWGGRLEAQVPVLRVWPRFDVMPSRV